MKTLILSVIVIIIAGWLLIAVGGGIVAAIGEMNKKDKNDEL